MSFFARLRSWMKWTMKGSRLEKEIDTEVRFHIESHTEDLVRSGIPQEEAMRRAKVEFPLIYLLSVDYHGVLGK